MTTTDLPDRCPTCSTADWSARVSGPGPWCFDRWHDRYEWTDDDRGALDIGSPDTWNPNGPFIGAFRKGYARRRARRSTIHCWTFRRKEDSELVKPRWRGALPR